VIREKPLPPDIQARLQTLGRALEACPAVVFAYLFGSAASGRLRPLSDVDVAVYLDESVDATDARLEVLGLLTRHLGTDEVDLVVLNTAPTALAGRILGTRRVILDGDPFRRHRFESLALRKFQDFRFLEHRLLSRRFGRDSEVLRQQSPSPIARDVQPPRKIRRTSGERSSSTERPSSTTRPDSRM